MILYPAIDLKAGKCVRLYQGDFQKTTCYSEHPITVANQFANEGASWLHVVDLDGAREGCPIQTDLILQLQKMSSLKLQVGGGIRKIEDIQTLLNQGIERVVLGSIAIKAPEKVQEWMKHFGAHRFVIAVDIKFQNHEPFIAEQGWQTLSSTRLWDLLDDYSNSDLQHILCTDIALDGTLKGPNILFYKMLQARYPHFNIQASGGVSSLDDLQNLSMLPVAGAIIGKALYEEQFRLADALKLAEVKTAC